MGTGYLSPASKWGRDGRLSAIFLPFARRLRRVLFGQDPELEIQLLHQKLDLLCETEMASRIATIRKLRQELKAPANVPPERASRGSPRVRNLCNGWPAAPHVLVFMQNPFYNNVNGGVGE